MLSLICEDVMLLEKKNSHKKRLHTLLIAVNFVSVAVSHKQLAVRKRSFL